MLLPSLRVQTLPLSVGATASYPYSDKLAQKFSLITRFGDPYVLYKRENGLIQLPRAACPIHNDHRSDGVSIKVKMTSTPRDEEQVRLIAEQNALLSRGESFIIQAGTGTGKSFVGCAAIAHVGKKTLIIVPKEDLMDQWVSDALLKFTDLKAHDIGIIQADKVSVTGKKVVMAMLHSLAIEDRYDPSMLGEFGFVIVDEAHRAGADSLSNAFSHIPARIRLGLSATVKRSDGKEQVLYAHIGPVKVTSNRLMLIPKVMSFRSQYRVQRVIKKDPDTGKPSVILMPHSPGKVMHIVTKMATDTARNELIAKLTHMAYLKGRKIAVFCDILDHIEALILANHRAGIPIQDQARYIGGLSKQARENAKERRVILATLGAFKEGTDIPALDTAVLATPRSDVVQAVGRILREYPDKKTPLVIDIVDADSPVFQGYYNKRKAWYQSIRSEIIEVG